MPERAAIYQVIQMGVEGASTPGTPVPATKRLQSMSFDPDPQAATDQFKPSGQKWLGVAPVGQESSQFRIGGRAVFDEIVYPLSSVLTRGIITSPGAPGAPLARFWTFVSATAAADDPASFTVEQGALGATDGDRYAGFYVTELGLTFTRQSVEVSGSGIGQALANPFAMTTSGITALPLVPVLPAKTDVYWDTTSAGLGGTKLLRCFRAEWRVGGRYTPIWPLNSANPSWERVAEGDPDMTCTIRVVADAQGMAFYNTYLRQGSTGYLRILNRGNFIDALTGVALTSSSSAAPPLFTTGAVHGLAVGDVIVIAGHSITAYNGTWRVLTAPLTTTFTAGDVVTGAALPQTAGGTGGTVTEQANPYEIRIDMASIVTAVGGKQVDQDLQMIEFTLSAQHDQAWGTGKSHDIRVTNKQTALT
jgi:hypothetical protein